MNQLKYSGMMETVRIRRAGFPVRRTFEDFLYRYHVLVRKSVRGTPQDQCRTLAGKFDPNGQDWQMGVSKVSGGDGGRVGVYPLYHLPLCLGIPKRDFRTSVGTRERVRVESRL